MNLLKVDNVTVKYGQLTALRNMSMHIAEGETLFVTGPNGAGKTTFARQHLKLSDRDYVFLNADEIARQLAGQGMSGPALNLQAGRLLLRQIA